MPSITSIGLSLAIAAFAQNEPPVHKCDELAASPFDPDAVAPGRPLEEIDGKKAEKACRDAIEHYPGTARFRLQLGRAYIAREKFKEAAREFQEAVRLDAEFGAALLALGTSYANGWGLAKDDREAFRLWMKATESGARGAKSSIARAYVLGLGVEKDYAEGARWLRESADEEGDKWGQFFLGTVTERGWGVETDHQEATRWFRLAAEQGVAPAQSRLAGKYMDGIGVAKDPREAMRWARKAAAQGDAKGQFFVGLMYGRGDGIARDDEEAVKWYRLAAEQNHVMAQWNLGRRYWTGQGLKKDEKKSYQWVKKAADAGLADAQAQLGWMYVYGHYVKKDPKEALRWYELAADQGLARAQNSLGLAYSRGDLGLRRDYQKAVELFQKAAEQKQDEYARHAQANLGDMYRYGNGVPQDFDKAAELYRRAAEQGAEYAQQQLDQLYDEGLASPPPPDWLGVGSTSGTATTTDESQVAELDVLSAEVEPTEVAPGSALKLTVHVRVDGLRGGETVKLTSERQLFFDDKPLIPDPLVNTKEFGRGSHAWTIEIPIHKKAPAGTYKYVVTVEGAGTTVTKQALFLVKAWAP